MGNVNEHWFIKQNNKFLEVRETIGLKYYTILAWTGSCSPHVIREQGKGLYLLWMTRLHNSNPGKTKEKAQTQAGQEGEKKTRT